MIIRNFVAFDTKIPVNRQKQYANRQERFPLSLYNCINDFSEFGEFLTQPVAKPTLIILGGGLSFNYLLQRYTEKLGYLIVAMPVSALPNEISNLEPAAVIFPSVESFEDSQPLALALTNCDLPLIVCSSLADQARSRELGADFCLLHPFAYDDFSAILTALTAQNVHRSDMEGFNPAC